VRQGLWYATRRGHSGCDEPINGLPALKAMTTIPKSGPKKARTVLHVPKTAQSAGWVDRRSWLGWSVLLVAVTLLAYLPALRGGFIWDDDHYVTQNQTLTHAAGLRQIWLEPTSTPQYYPLVHTTFWLEYHLWGLHPAGYHIVNVLLHTLAALLLWCTLARVELPGAWLAAAIFALHPIEAESVAWVSERKNVLSAVFYFSAALAYLRFSPLAAGEAPGKRRWSWYALAVALFGAALLSKTVTCSLPAALLLARWWKRGRVSWRDVVPLLPFFVIGAGFGVGTVWLEKHHVGAQGAPWSLTWMERGLVAGRALCFYAAKLVWPAQLTFIYPKWKLSAAQWWQWLFPLAALGIVAVLWTARRRIGRGPLAAVLFFAVTLGPALGFFAVYPMRYSFVADHFQYLAGVGLIALGAAALSRIPRFALAVLPTVLGVLTWQQTGIYSDIETLWRDTLAKNPRCWLAHNNLGLELENQGRFKEAFQQYAQALPLEPDFPETYNNFGNALMRQERISEAMENYRQAIRLDPKYVEALNSLGVALGVQGDYSNAIVFLHEALRLRPGYAPAHANLGNVMRMQNNPDGAIREYVEALRLAPNDAAGHKNLGLTMEGKGLYVEAAEQYQESLRLNPTAPDTHFNLARVLVQLGRIGECAAHLKEAVRLKPDYKQAREALKALEEADSKHE
jgi:protein O-mannosyl-transferase